jgi:hypothetical protein
MDAGLFIHAEHDRVLGRVHAEADNFQQLLFELWNRTEIECPETMGLEVEFLEDALNGRLRHLHVDGKQTMAPPSVAFWRLAADSGDNQLDSRRFVFDRLSGAWLVIECFKPSIMIKVSPFGH